jgi:formylglycine-generating enzyme required for sulfatase activity
MLSCRLNCVLSPDFLSTWINIMADTRRGVSWSLERPCALRRGEGWSLPAVTRQQLADISVYSSALAENEVLDDICVTANTYGSDSAGNTIMLPCSGFRVSLALAPFGGEAAVRAACGSCEANVRPGKELGLAGCHGFLAAWPDSEELEAELREKIHSKSLEESVARLFASTTPLWYGFWIESPLRRPHCELLLELLEGTDDPNEKRDADVLQFLAALRAAIDWELPLHVEMAPPGHTDFGFYNVFRHCPRCKADAPVARWQESYADEVIDCKVCGHRYNPAATHKREQMDDSDWEAGRLENLLGAGEADVFRRRFLAHRGCSPEQIEDILDRENNGPLKRRINEFRQRQSAIRGALPTRTKVSGPMPPLITLEFGGDVTMRLWLTPAGEFLMGTASSPDGFTNQAPQHVVCFARPFYLGIFPVTQAQFEAVMGYNPSRFTGDSDRPVEKVSWFAAQEFCMRLSQATGRWVRLPREAEWEYACRAGTKSKYPWGEEMAAEQVNAKIRDPLEPFPTKADLGTEEISTSVQGRYPPNAWGFYDMLGNVEEWCEDEWHDNYVGAPADGSAWVTPGDENPFRVVRGGSCWHIAAACTSAARVMTRGDAHGEPEEPVEDDAFQALLTRIIRDQPPMGFRVVVDVE